MKTKKLCAILGLGVVVLMAVSLSVVNAQEGAPPVLPCAFYGSVTIDEKPAPVGTEITAKMDNKTCGNITVTEEGRYGAAVGLKLAVIGTAAAENKIISFYVDEVKAEESATWHSGEIYNLDLSVKKAGAGPTISPGAGEGAIMPIAAVLTVVAVVIVVAVALMFVGWRKRRKG